jgi:copper homeostasis protein
MEVCVDSVESAVNAVNGGASRLELCCALSEGGLTPSVGLLRVVKQEVNVPVFVMIRPRGGDFAYSEQEFEVMKEDLIALKDIGDADGFVLGILTRDGEVDTRRCSQLIELARPQPVTFHRAFDMTRDPFRALEAIVGLRVERVLTSGQETTALEGLPLLQELVERARGRTTVIAGGGITERNLERILRGSGCREFHCSGRTNVDSVMQYRNPRVRMGAQCGVPEYSLRVADTDRIQTMISIAQSIPQDTTHIN